MKNRVTKIGMAVVPIRRPPHKKKLRVGKDGIVPPAHLFKPPLTEERGLQIEPKYFDVSATTNVTWNLGAIDITAPAQGVGYTQRIADEISVDSIELGAELYAASTTSTTVRVILFKWNIDTNLGTPGPAELLTAGGGNVVTVVSALNLDRVRAGEIEVVFDQVFGVAGLTVDRPIAFRKMFPLKSRVRFNPAGTTGVGKFFLFFSSQATATDATAVWYARVNFIDS